MRKRDSVADAFIAIGGFLLLVAAGVVFGCIFVQGQIEHYLPDGAVDIGYTPVSNGVLTWQAVIHPGLDAGSFLIFAGFGLLGIGYILKYSLRRQVEESGHLWKEFKVLMLQDDIEQLRDEMARDERRERERNEKRKAAAAVDVQESPRE